MTKGARRELPAVRGRSVLTVPARTIICALVVLALVAGAGGTDLLGGDDDTGVPASGGLQQANVTRVVDGDTVVLSGLGRSRLIGIDTPEVYGRRECFGAQASAYTKRVLGGRRVSYSIGPEPRDRYGRALVYVWLRDGSLFNELLVTGGYARPLAIAPNTAYARRFARLADDARRRRVGLWAASACPAGRSN